MKEPKYVWQEGHPEYARHYYGSRKSMLKSKYGLTMEHLADMMNKQKGCCAICGDSLVRPESKRSYHIDYCHKSGKVRGLLCAKCNRALGFVERVGIDTIEWYLYEDLYRDII